MVVGVAAAAFVLCSLMPVGHLLVQSLAGGIGDISALVLDGRQRGLLWNTGVLGVSTAMLATALGAPLGIALARVRLPLKGLLRLALALPALLPPYIVALAWTYLIRSDSAYSLLGAIVVLSLVLYPLPMLATEVALRRIDGRLEEAGLVYAPPPLVLRQISLPLAAPSILAAALIVFVLSVSEFGVPSLLRVRVYTTEVFTAFAALYDFGRAVMLSVPLLFVSLVAASVAIALIGDPFISSRRALGTDPVSLDGWTRRAVAVAIMVLTIAVGIPVMVLAKESLGVDSMARVASGSGPAIQKSIGFSALGATAVVGIGVWLGYARARAQRRWGQFADILMVVSFAVPSTIVGVGLIGLWNRPGFFGSLYGTDAMVIIGYLARFIPVGVLMIAATMRYVPVSHEEAAAASGAGWLRTMSHIVIPQVRLGLVTAWVVAFVLAFGELGVSILVSPAGETTLPIRIYTLIANTAPAHVAALALLQTTVILCPVALLGIAIWVRDAQ